MVEGWISSPPPLPPPAKRSSGHEPVFAGLMVLPAVGMFFTAWSSVQLVTCTKYAQDICKELLLSLVASLCMGFGGLLPAALGWHLCTCSQGLQQGSFTGSCFCKLIFFFFTIAANAQPAAHSKGRCVTIKNKTK